MNVRPVDFALTAPSGSPAVVLVLGDLCADLIAVGNVDGRFTDAADPTDELTFRTSFAERAGGTAFHFARAAADGGLRPILVGAVGADDSGRMIRRELASRNLDRVIFEREGRGTGRVVLAYDNTGRRLMLAERDSANRYLPDPTAALDSLEGRIDVVWVSGVSICDSTAETYSAVLRAVAAGRRRGARVLVDVVPHEFHHHFPSMDRLIDTLGGVDGLVSEQSSLRRLLRLGSAGEEIGPEQLGETANAALAKVPMAIVRQRAGGTYHQVAVSRESPVELSRQYETYGDERMAGLGDKLVCSVLPEMLAAGFGQTAGIGGGRDE